MMRNKDDWWIQQQVENAVALKNFDLRLQGIDTDYDWKTDVSADPLLIEPFVLCKGSESSEIWYWQTLISKKALNSPYKEHLYGYKPVLVFNPGILSPIAWKLSARNRENTMLRLLDMFIKEYGAEKLKEWKITIYPFGPSGTCNGIKDGKEISIRLDWRTESYLEIFISK